MAAPTPTLRHAQKALTRARLIDAGARCFVENGYSATTIDEIAKAAGATRATFYLHFPSKAELALDVWMLRIDAPTRTLWARLHEIMLDLHGNPERLRTEWFPSIIEHCRERGSLVNALWNAGPLEHLIKTELERTREMVTEVILRSVEVGAGHSPAGWRIRAAAAFELQNQMFLHWVTGAIPQDEADLIDALYDGWRALLMSPTPL